MVRKNISVLAYGIAALALVALSSAVFLEWVFPIDTTILQAIRQLHSPTMDVVMVAITRLGNPKFTVPLVFVVFTLLWVKKHRLEAKLFALNCMGGAVFSTGLKLFFGKVRPALWNSPIEEVTFSYPSGHALGAVVLYGFLAYLLGRRLPKYKGVIYVGAIALALAIGFTRLYLGVHWPTDLLGGYIIGFLWTSSCILFLKKRLPTVASPKA
ncbi:MAG: phosphatase PAP2 family protein [Phormidesmis sp.]